MQRLSASNRISLLLTLLSSLWIAGCGGGSNSSPESPSQLSQPVANIPDTTPETNILVPVVGNSWIANEVDVSNSLIGDQGLTNWLNIDHELVTFVYLENTGSLHLSIDAKVHSGSSTLEVEVGNKSSLVTLENTEMDSIYVDEFTVESAGYQRIVIRGINHIDNNIADIKHVKIGGDATSKNVYFVKDDFYWGRRGPSVHLNYQVPQENTNYEWFYTELTVPNGQDTLGSYFMANGFAQGYMGIQVNSPTERRVLFSVWSPYQTDNPNDIPDEYKIELLKKGQHVYTGEFGNEGSGGQSYLVYDWQPDTRYRFLLRIAPASIDDFTDYTAYFYAPEQEQWQLIASFRRPKTTTYVDRPHAFLENFITGAGQFERKAFYGNQWLRTLDGQWQAIVNASFSYDATADKKSRMDYQGGEENGEFYLRNTGFFTGPTEYGTQFTRQSTTEPNIDFSLINDL